MSSHEPEHNAVVLLRGVNVNGITVTSAALRQCLGTIADVEAVGTVLASGNAVLRTVLSPEQVKDAAEQALRRDLGYEAWVVVVEQERLERLLADLPWNDDDPDVHVYLTFASDPAVLDAVEHETRQQDAGQPLLRPEPGVLVWRCPRGQSTTTALARRLARAALRSTTTTRNLRTVRKVAALRP